MSTAFTRRRFVVGVVGTILLVAIAAGAWLRLPDGNETDRLPVAVLQHELDALVSDPEVAPGAAAALVTRDSSWAGAAGVADRGSGRAMGARRPLPDRQHHEDVRRDRRAPARGGGRAAPRRAGRKAAAARLHA